MRRKSKWIGPFNLSTTLQAEGAPRIDGCSCTVVEVDNETGAEVHQSHAKGYAIRYRGREAIVVAVRCKYPSVPLPPKLWLRVKWLRLLWTLHGRPEIAPMGVNYGEDLMRDA